MKILCAKTSSSNEEEVLWFLIKEYKVSIIDNEASFDILSSGVHLKSWCLCEMDQVMRKCVLCHMRTTKVQISLRIRAVWSAPLLFTA